MRLLAFVIVVVYYTAELSGQYFLFYDSVVPLNSTSIYMIWTPLNVGSRGGTIKINVCGISSSYSTILRFQTSSDLHRRFSYPVTGLQPDSVYHACARDEYISLNNMGGGFSSGCKLVRTFKAGQCTYMKSIQSSQLEAAESIRRR
jgi:hypothetical protein